MIGDDEDGVVGIEEGVGGLVCKEVMEECLERGGEEYGAMGVYGVRERVGYMEEEGGGKNVVGRD